MILSAGFGKRLHPLTLDMPKPLVTIGAETLLDYHLKHVKEAGFTKAIINTHYLAKKIEAHLEMHGAMPYAISHEDDLLETGGGIAKALDHFNKPFLSINSDAYTHAHLPSLYAMMASIFDPDTMDVLLLLVPTKKMLGYEGQGDFFIHSLTNKKKGLLTFKGDAPSAPYVYTGIQILHPRAFESSDFSMIQKWVIPELWKKCGERLLGVIVEDGDWFDTGNHTGLALARRSHG
ncbi:MAG: nucleotidyltransferase family protein [Alphaproteobacteria bacterium]|nr:nucleotidyltransferase family protein [Alphaproteobacteria bacterium]